MALKKYRLSGIFILSLVIVTLITILGPFRYTIYSYGGIAYLFLCAGLFACGLNVKRIRIGHRSIDNDKGYMQYTLTNLGVSVIDFLSIIVIFASIIHLLRVARLNIGSFTFAQGDFRSAITDNRDNFSRFTEMLMHLSAPVYLIAKSSESEFPSKTNVLVNVSFWIVPLVYLGEGARWSIFFFIILFFVFRRCRWQKTANVTWGKLLGGIVIVVGLIYILSLVFNLFSIRGIYTADRLHFFSMGDITLKEWADKLYRSNPAFFNPIWKVFNYFGQSIAVFSYTFKNVDPSYPKTLGLNIFNVLQYLLIPFGYSTAEYKKLVLGMPGAGYYSTFITEYILDFGIIFTPIMLFLTGVVFSAIEKRYNTSLLSRNMYYLLVPMCIVAPIYSMWHVASVNIDIFLLIILTFVLKRIRFGERRLLVFGELNE